MIKHVYLYVFILIYRELTELLGYKHNIEPLVVSGKGGTVLRADRVNISQTETREKE